MWERLKVCWYVLTMHTYVVFFCTKDIKHQKCYVKNTFDLFDKTIVQFVTDSYVDYLFKEKQDDNNPK